jgi:hypothetical protein
VTCRPIPTPDGGEYHDDSCDCNFPRNARDDYPELLRMLGAMDNTDEPDWIDVRTFDASAIGDALDEIDRLRACVTLMIEMHGAPSADDVAAQAMDEHTRMWADEIRGT